METHYAGIWVDHRQAYIVGLDEDGHTTVGHASSGYPHRHDAGEPVHSRQRGEHGTLPRHRALARKRRQHCRRLYECVFEAVRDVPRVYIVGPGQAKKELARHLQEHKDFRGTLDAVEAAQKMPQGAIVALVCRFFGLGRARGGRRR